MSLTVVGANDTARPLLPRAVLADMLDSRRARR